MFCSDVSFVCYFLIPVCYRETNQYIFSSPAGTQFADCITCLATNNFVSVWTDTAFLSVYFFYIFELKDVWAFFVSMFHLFVISPSLWATKVSAEQSTHTFLVVWRAHNLMIALTASRSTIWFQFEQTLHFHQFTFYSFLSLNMSEHVSFPCFIHLPFLHSSVLQKAQQSYPPIHF